jgi:hypothetical protein
MKHHTHNHKQQQHQHLNPLPQEAQHHILHFYWNTGTIAEEGIK